MVKIYKVLKWTVAASLLSGIFVAGSCSREEAQPIIPTEAEAASGRITVESALEALARFQSDDSQTRTQATPAVAHIDVLMRSEVGPATRSAAPAEEVPLCYIAQFEGGGYAILGADPKQSSVVAYVPKGNLTAAELAAAKDAMERGADCETSTYINACVVDYLEAAADGRIAAQKEPNESSEIQTRGLELPSFDPDAPVELMVTTWHQDAPFNTYCFTQDGKQAKVGCVALALGQVLAYNKKMYDVGPTEIRPVGLYLPGDIFYPYWPYITKAIETATPAPAYQMQIAQYLHALGRAVGMSYGSDISNAELENVLKFLKGQTTYKNVELRTANLQDIRTQLRNSKTPVYASGVAQVNVPDQSIYKGGQHSWVIDGWMLKKVWVPIGGGFTGDYATNVDYVYCRFGYNGNYDGWYDYSSLSANGSTYYRILRIISYSL